MHTTHYSAAKKKNVDMEMDRFDVDLQVCVVKEQGRKENQDMPKRYVEISELGFVYRCLFINSTDMSDC